MNPKTLSFAKTATGLEIGRSYIQRPPTEIGSEAEAIQKALLRRPSLIQTKTPWYRRLVEWLRGESEADEYQRSVLAEKNSMQIRSRR